MRPGTTSSSTSRSSTIVSGGIRRWAISARPSSSLRHWQRELTSVSARSGEDHLSSLRRKPGALRTLAWRDALFPLPAFRQAWELLTAAGSLERACRAMVTLLDLAARHGEALYRHQYLGHRTGLRVGSAGL